MSSAKKMVVVVDSGPLIRGIDLERFAREAFTVPQVFAELKDPETRRRMAALVVPIVTREPSAHALSAVTSFSTKTGDYSSLSRTDLHVLALAYQIERERNGDANLRSEPPTLSDRQRILAEEEERRWQRQQKQQEALRSSSSIGVFAEGHQTRPFDSNAFLMSSSRDEYNAAVGVSESDVNGCNDDDAVSVVSSSVGSSTNSRPFDDTIGWITPENIGSVSKGDGRTWCDDADEDEEGEGTGEGGASSDAVCCMTTDFAMQNVLMQMGLKVVSSDGLLIRRAKTYIRKCHACAKRCVDPTREFCPSCGNAALLRVAVSITSTGIIEHLKHNMQFRVRGTKFSIPEPKSGRHSRNLILREDQRERVIAQNNIRHSRRKEENVFHPDYVVGKSPFSAATSDWRKQDRSTQFAHGRRNPNAARRLIKKK